MSSRGPENPLEVYERNLEVYEINKLFPERLFVSHWDIDFPGLVTLHEKLRANPSLGPKEIGKYQFFDENVKLKERIVDIHHTWEGLALQPPHLLLGDGGSPLISSFLLWMKSRGEHTLYYVPPIYYTFHKLAALVGIRLAPISGRQEFQDEFSPRLPPAGGLLYVADPIWYVGRRYSDKAIGSLRSWQLDTGGRIFVDGSFQFMQWDGTRLERSSRLVPEQTFRLVSPTKAMALHGLRLAYLVCPDVQTKVDLNWIYEDSHGPSSVAHQRIAEALIEAFASDPGNRPFMQHAERQFTRLRDSGALKAWVTPECGNFAFVHIREPGPDWLGLSATHFEVTGYEHHVRVNLLNDGIVQSILCH